MNKQLIKNWNSVIKYNDDVYILGDIFYRESVVDANEILSKLKGRKYLIKGNHDTFIEKKGIDTSVFEWIKNYHVLKYDKRKFVLFHFPIYSWQSSRKGSIHLYGYVHNNEHEVVNEVLGNNSYNVGADLNNFTPISIYEVIDKIEKQNCEIISNGFEG